MSVYTSRPSVGITATLIAPAHSASGDNQAGCSVMLYNPGPADVLVGNASVTTSIGLTLPSGASMQADLEDGEVLYGIVATGSQTVHVLETGV